MSDELSDDGGVERRGLPGGQVVRRAADAPLRRDAGRGRASAGRERGTRAHQRRRVPDLWRTVVVAMPGVLDRRRAVGARRIAELCRSAGSGARSSPTEMRCSDPCSRRSASIALASQPGVPTPARGGASPASAPAGSFEGWPKRARLPFVSGAPAAGVRAGPWCGPMETALARAAQSNAECVDRIFRRLGDGRVPVFLADAGDLDLQAPCLESLVPTAAGPWRRSRYWERPVAAAPTVKRPMPSPSSSRRLD
jgi:hypothetical protein